MKKKNKQSNVLFKKKTLADQVADNLRASIRNGVWKKFLPTERSLCLTVEASRPELRKAIHKLQKEGLVEIVHGHPTRIIGSRLKKEASRVQKRAVLLFGGGFVISGTWQIVFVDELRNKLIAAGYAVEVVADMRMRWKKLVTFLEEVVLRHEESCWILCSVPLVVQEWFQKQGLHAVVNGSTFPQVKLPSADYDHRATARHAGGVFLGLGHRRIVCLLRDTQAAGDFAMQKGFEEAFQAHENCSFRLIWHSGESTIVRARLKSLLAEKPRPTAILISHGIDLLVVVTALLEWGVRIPRDISLISLHSDDYLNSLTPIPAQYDLNAVKLASSTCHLVENPSYGGGSIRMIPPFAPGGSLAAPPKLQA